MFGMFPFLEFALQGLSNPAMLASQMATAGIGPEMAASAMGIGQMVPPTPPVSPIPMPEMAGQMGAGLMGRGVPQTPGPEIAGTDPDLYNRFMSRVSTGVNNPNGLAAVAATGMRESGFKPGNVYGTWDDVGKPAGGAMSWRAERLNNLTGGKPISEVPIEAQADFFLNENPELIARLNAAQSPEEAQRLMNDAWAFKGYDNPEHPETQARMELSNKLAPEFMSGNVGTAGSTIDFSRAGGAMPTPAISPGGERTQELSTLMTPIVGGGLDAASSSSTGQTLGGGVGAPGPQSFGQKLAGLGKGLAGQKDPQQRNQQPIQPTGSAPQVGGGFGRDPQAIQQMMALLMGGAGPQLPQLSQMIQPRR